MIGAATNVAPVLDYTGVPTPFSVDDVERDMRELEADYAVPPEEIKMWEHQWDWLVKEVDNTGGYLYGEPDDRVGYKMLWGIRVTIVEPKPIAVLRIDTPLTDEEAEEIRERFEATVTMPAFKAQIQAEQQAIIDRAAAKAAPRHKQWAKAIGLERKSKC